MKYQTPAAQGAFHASGRAGYVHWWPLVEPAMDILSLVRIPFMELYTPRKFNMEPENDGFQKEFLIFPGAHFQVNHGNNWQVDYDYNNIFFKWYQLWTGLYLNINCWYRVPFDTPVPSCKWHGSNWPNVLANQAWSSRNSRTVAVSQPLGSTKWNIKKTPKKEIQKVEMRMNKHERENCNGSIYIYILFLNGFLLHNDPISGGQKFEDTFGIQAWEHSLASTELD